MGSKIAAVNKYQRALGALLTSMLVALVPRGRSGSLSRIRC